VKRDIIVEVGGAQLLPDALDFWVYPLVQPLAPIDGDDGR
jgi:hypothetical protein